MEEDHFPLNPDDGITVYWAYSVFANSHVGRTARTCVYPCQLVATRFPKYSQGSRPNDELEMLIIKKVIKKINQGLIIPQLVILLSKVPEGEKFAL